MNDTEVLDLYNEMVTLYGDRLPDPEHEPRQFHYFVKLFLYYRRQDGRTSQDQAL